LSRPGRRRHWVIVALLAGAAAFAGPTPEELQPTVPPGYVPRDSRDEQGIWYEMGEFEAALQRSPLLLRDVELNEYVESVACRVAGPYCPDIRIYLVRNTGFNASMAPNGMMQVWSGLLIRVVSEDELAAILGHEIAHYARAHSIERFRRLKKSMTVGSIFSIGLAAVTGVSTDSGRALASAVGDLGARLSTLAFTRKQETEADLLGTTMMAEATFDPHASYQVWEMLLDEEQSAVAKGHKPATFMSTHPPSEARAELLRQWVLDLDQVTAADRVDRHRDAIAPHYTRFLEDQVDTNRYGRTEAILDRHVAMGYDASTIEYFRGETYRQRGGEGDQQRAREAYMRATDTDDPYPRAHRDLGYAYVKTGDLDTARQHFRRYLELDPLASDRAMIEFYLAEGI
jgi:predicted Zn-dependent protease